MMTQLNNKQVTK